MMMISLFARIVLRWVYKCGFLVVICLHQRCKQGVMYVSKLTILTTKEEEWTLKRLQEEGGRPRALTCNWWCLFDSIDHGRPVPDDFPFMSVNVHSSMIFQRRYPCSHKKMEKRQEHSLYATTSLLLPSTVFKMFIEPEYLTSYTYHIMYPRERKKTD